MNNLNKRNLALLARFIRKLPDEDLDMRHFCYPKGNAGLGGCWDGIGPRRAAQALAEDYRQCGTVCCALGWAYFGVPELGANVTMRSESRTNSWSDYCWDAFGFDSFDADLWNNTFDARRKSNPTDIANRLAFLALDGDPTAFKTWTGEVWPDPDWDAVEQVIEQTNATV